MVRVLGDQTAQAPVIGELQCIVFQFQDQSGASIRLVNFFDAELPIPGRAPADALGITGFTGFDDHFIRDHEARIKADAELADQGAVFLLIAG